MAGGQSSGSVLVVRRDVIPSQGSSMSRGGEQISGELEAAPRLPLGRLSLCLLPGLPIPATAWLLCSGIALGSPCSTSLPPAAAVGWISTRSHTEQAAQSGCPLRCPFPPHPAPQSCGVSVICTGEALEGQRDGTGQWRHSSPPPCLGPVGLVCPLEGEGLQQ
ncbi:30S ribosomal protein S2 [Platysternon megacephalum]|uniref:30S ribosomal protein S2 n=1 Tax=Platysternon megacephalum TaxID=55544 RepID=A0A4D9DH20_9SAUR|nr:30S ribosomal protein S2 [Platysternon megacephalum]